MLGEVKKLHCRSEHVTPMNDFIGETKRNRTSNGTLPELAAS